MDINIENFHIHISPVKEREVNRSNENKIVDNPFRDYYLPSKAPDGIYIVTDSGDCWKEDRFSKCKEGTVGIAIIEGNRRIIVDKMRSYKSFRLLSEKKDSGLRESYHDNGNLEEFDGYANTEVLFSLGSPAAEYCKRKGNRWYIPSAGELYFMNRHKYVLNRMLSLIGGDPLLDEWYWTSTRCYGKDYIVISLDVDGLDHKHQDSYNWVRPVSVFS